MLYGLNAQLVYLASAGAAGLVLVLLLAYIIVLNRRIKRLEAKYTFFMQDETGKSVEAKLRDDVAQLRDMQNSLEALHHGQDEIAAVQHHCLQKIGFVRYNAFENIGNNLSFACTVLDGKNDGFCLSSVYGRSESRIFAKPIVDGKCLYGMSEEEQESLEGALQYSGNIQDIRKN